MGAVYLAHDPVFGRDVAVKVLPRQLLSNASLRARFEREARTIAQLEHPAIVPVHDFGEEAGQPYLVMRLMTGGSLADRLHGGRLPLVTVVNLVERIASALDKAHANDIVHRDLKPANILFDGEGRPYLSDFGIVKVADEATLTATGGLIGTPAYMSPEQARGEIDVDARSDVYSLGVVVYEALSGARPYQADTPVAVAMKHIMDPVPSLQEDRPDLQPNVSVVVAQAMAKDPAERFQTAGAFTTAFKSAASVQPRPSAEIQTPPQGARLPAACRRHPILCSLAALLLALAIAGMGGFYIQQTLAGGNTPSPSASSPALAVVAEQPSPSPTRDIQPTFTATPSLTPSPAATPSPSSSPTPSSTPTGTATASSSAELSLPAQHIGEDGVTMRLVPAGEFIMGSTNEQVQEAMVICSASGANDPCGLPQFSNEMPQHVVYVSAFYMDETEITNGQYRACVEAGVCAAPAPGLGRYHPDEYYRDPRFDDFPVIRINWHDAQTYCSWVGERLPTEAEWEKAARGEDGRLFPWGDAFDGTRANTEELGGDVLRPVGQYPPGQSPYGILDLSGSVWEWVSDWFDPDYYSTSPTRDPPGPATGSDKVLRGGGYSNHQHYARSTNRGFERPGTSSAYRGFRCVIGADRLAP